MISRAALDTKAAKENFKEKSQFHHLDPSQNVGNFHIGGKNKDDFLRFSMYVLKNGKRCLTP